MGLDHAPSSPVPGVPELSLVIPVFDEEENIEQVTREIVDKLGPRVDFEVVFVDDGSRDQTAARIESLSAEDPRLRLIRHGHNRGKSAALVSGALAARAPIVANMDGDGQNDPADVVRLFEGLRSGAGEGVRLVAGKRRKRRDSWLKRVSSRVANGVRASLLRDATPDTACGLKAYYRDDFLEFPHFENMHRFLPALCLRNGGAVRSIEVDDRPRVHGVSKYGFHNRLWPGLFDLVGVMWLRRRGIEPLRRKETRP